MSYFGIIVKLENVRKLENADRLQTALCVGHSVVVGLEAREGDINIFFPPDGKLSAEFLNANDLLPVLDAEGKKISGGYFDLRGRVRSQVFRKSKSEGFAIPISSLSYTGYNLSKLSVGDHVTKLNGHLICEKYFTPQTIRAQKAALLKAAKVKILNFPEHQETAAFKFVGKDIPASSLITITYKEHGTSQRFANALITRNYVQRRLVSVIQRLKTVVRRLSLKRLSTYVDKLSNLAITLTNRKLFMTKPKYGHVIGTRRTVLDENSNTSYYATVHGSEQFRYDVVTGIQLHKGEVVYGEVVGWVGENTPIMQQGIDKETRKSLGKDFAKQYPNDQMIYKYGVPNGKAEFHVYRITQINEDGVVTELTWTNVVRRCQELGLKTVQLVYLGNHPYGDECEFLSNPFLYGGNVRDLQELLDSLLDKPAKADPSHLEEGICLRVDAPDGSTQFIKHKSFLFFVLEGIRKLDDNYVDTEEAVSEPLDNQPEV